MNLHLESKPTSTTELFLQKLATKIQVRPGSKYPSDGRNKLFSFSIKTTLKVTTLGIRMCFTELLLWKNQKSLPYHFM